MKPIALVLLVLLAGCASDPARRLDVAKSEVATMDPPSVSLSTFDRYELLPMTMSSAVSAEEPKVAQANRLEQKLRAKLLPLLGEWNSGAGEGTLLIQPELVELRIVSGGARFWAGAWAGESNIAMKLRLTHHDTGEAIASPRVERSAGAMAGGWSVGRSDRSLHDYIVDIAYQYLVENY